MDELEDKLNAIFSSPERMEEIRRLAQSFAGGAGETAPPPEAPPGAASPLPGIDPAMFSTLRRLLESSARPSEASRLFEALRPFLNRERAEKLDRALRAARLARLAREILPELGGERNV